MNLQEALNELGERLGIGSIELDDQGGCVLVCDDDLAVEIERAEDGPGFYLSAPVGPVPTEGREAVFAELLEANLLGRGSGPASFALDGDLDELLMTRYVDRDDVDVTALEEALEGLLGLADGWRRRLENGEIGTLRGLSDADPGPADPGGGSMRA